MQGKRALTVNPSPQDGFHQDSTPGLLHQPLCSPVSAEVTQRIRQQLWNYTEVGE